MKRLLCVALTCALVGAGVRAGEGKLVDGEFIKKAIVSGVAEVKISELAAKNATNADVKSLAQHLAKDHSKLNKDLMEQAEGLKVAVVTGLEKDRQEKYNQLSKLEGAEFDREYLRQMIEGHEASIKLFENQAKSGTHEKLRTLAAQTLPALRQHLKMAQNLAQK
jgi:putative membrane protein